MTDIHPLNDPAVWEAEPMYEPPADVDIEAVQRRINEMMGVTRDNQPIYKLIWNGDQRFWWEYFYEWNAIGKPTTPPRKRPRVRHKTLVDAHGGFIRDTFAPRWLIVSRIEPEQYAKSWERESFFTEPVFQGFRADPITGKLLREYRNIPKQIRPIEPPPVFWAHYMIIEHHNEWCCDTAARDKRLCRGEYAPPGYAFKTLEAQAEADRKEGVRGVYQQVDTATVTEFEEQLNGYRREIREIEIQSEIFIENPYALLGVAATLKAEVGLKQARQIAADHFKRELDERSKLI
jgi:hypothetical protein